MGINRLMFLAGVRGFEQCLGGANNRADLSAKVIQIISELESEKSSRLAVITWSNQHLANKLHASFEMLME